MPFSLFQMLHTKFQEVGELVKYQLTVHQYPPLPLLDEHNPHLILLLQNSHLDVRYILRMVSKLK